MDDSVIVMLFVELRNSFNNFMLRTWFLGPRSHD